MSVETSEKIYETRSKAAALFGLSSPENVIFTPNCTHALNTAIKGLAFEGCHFVTSSLEHNAVIRPLETLRERGVCTFSVAEVAADDGETVENFRALLQENTVAIVLTGASNVFGKILPVRRIAKLAKEMQVKLIVDCAQTAGLLPIRCEEIGVDYLCVAGHKGLYGPMGTGMLLCREQLPLNTLIEGGTGSYSAEPLQPQAYPDRFESGTVNTPGIIALGAGIDFVASCGEDALFAHEEMLMRYLYKALRETNGVVLYTDYLSTTERFVPLLSFNVDGLHSEETARLLSRNGIAVRAGLHCAPMAHTAYGSMETGTVRVCPSIFTKKQDMDLLIISVRKIAKNR